MPGTLLQPTVGAWVSRILLSWVFSGSPAAFNNLNGQAIASRATIGARVTKVYVELGNKYKCSCQLPMAFSTSELVYEPVGAACSLPQVGHTQGRKSR